MPYYLIAKERKMWSWWAIEAKSEEEALKKIEKDPDLKDRLGYTYGDLDATDCSGEYDTLEELKDDIIVEDEG